MTDFTRSVRIARRREAGFTLIELLVALALFSLLSAALFGSMRYGIGAWKRTSTHVDQVDHTMQVQAFLRHMIEDAYPLFISDGPTHKYVDFRGTNSSLNFLTSVPIALATGGRSRLTLSVAPTADHVDLVVTSKQELTSRDDSTLTKMILLNDLQSVEFSYFGRALSDKVAEWHDHWNDEAALPQLMRVQVRYPAGDPRTWPAMLIAPRITADVGCVHDPLTNGCRGR
jgi:general secretion pathway protein J